jgi:hypothetical protein
MGTYGWRWPDNNGSLMWQRPKIWLLVAVLACAAYIAASQRSERSPQPSDVPVRDDDTDGLQRLDVRSSNLGGTAPDYDALSRPVILAKPAVSLPREADAVASDGASTAVKSDRTVIGRPFPVSGSVMQTCHANLEKCRKLLL